MTINELKALIDEAKKEAVRAGLEDKLDIVTKQRNALIIALNYVNNTMIAMKWGANARPEDMERVVTNALIMAARESGGTIILEVREDGSIN